ncbi:MAG: hypothetical protein Q8Q92_00415 [bacterium]|nr:hypothetical protein [bacterium]
MLSRTSETLGLSHSRRTSDHVASTRELLIENLALIVRNSQFAGGDKKIIPKPANDQMVLCSVDPNNGDLTISMAGQDSLAESKHIASVSS